jgi:hypothetical protein
MIPPFGINQTFSDAEIVDILWFATPPEWQRKMNQMGLNPIQCSSLELLCFLENCEAVKVPNNATPGNAAPGWQRCWKCVWCPRTPQ